MDWVRLRRVAHPERLKTLLGALPFRVCFVKGWGCFPRAPIRSEAILPQFQSQARPTIPQQTNHLQVLLDK
jgi:hypothetical protein